MPFYITPSGLPQISDVIMVVLILTLLYKDQLFFRQDQFIILLGFMLGTYILVINGLWSIYYNSHYFNALRTSSWYFYNLLVLFVVISLYRIQGSQKVFHLMYKALFWSLTIQLLFMPFSYENNVREQLFFNNPNQLAYFSLLSIALVLFLKSRITIDRKAFIYLITISMTLVIISLSKAAIITAILMIVIYMFNIKKIFKLRYILLLFTIIISLTAFIKNFNVSYISDSNEFLFNLYTRFDTMFEQDDSSLEGRAYDKILLFKERMVFGAGEAFNDRLRYRASMEIHSTLINFLFSYGLVGFIILLALLGMLFNFGYKLDKVIYIALLGVFIYGLTHNGIRNPLLWILFGLIYISITNEKKTISHSKLTR